MKSLLVETETVQKEYEKYIQFDFERKLSETKRKYFSKSSDCKFIFIVVRDPPIELFIVVCI